MGWPGKSEACAKISQGARLRWRPFCESSDNGAREREIESESEKCAGNPKPLFMTTHWTTLMTLVVLFFLKRERWVEKGAKGCVGFSPQPLKVLPYRFYSLSPGESGRVWEALCRSCCRCRCSCRRFSFFMSALTLNTFAIPSCLCQLTPVCVWVCVSVSLFVGISPLPLTLPNFFFRIGQRVYSHALVFFFLTNFQCKKK